MLVTLIGFGARAVLGEGAHEAVGKGGNLAAPMLAQALGGGEGTTGGDVALALFSPPRSPRSSRWWPGSCSRRRARSRTTCGPT